MGNIFGSQHLRIMTHDDYERIYGNPSQSKIVKSRRFTKMIVEQKEKRFITERFTPNESWKPFRLINDRLGVAHTIKIKMGWTEICRDVLKDDTHPSSIRALVIGNYKTTNGWRCEYL
jgi:hypothetical protein